MDIWVQVQSFAPVFDPFGGSGTTYAVAEYIKELGLAEIGEVDPIINRQITNIKILKL